MLLANFVFLIFSGRAALYSFIFYFDFVQLYNLHNTRREVPSEDQGKKMQAHRNQNY